MNIVIIDGVTLNSNVLNWDRFQHLGNVSIYEEKYFTNANDELKLANVVVTNKFEMRADLINSLPNLKCICITATGYNIIDVEAAREKNIIVCNAPEYSTVSTAQHTIALMLELTNHCGIKNKNVQEGQWTESGSWCDNRLPNVDMFNKTMGIIGVGAIGKQVGNIARALGMRTIGYSRSQPSGNNDGVEMVDLDTLYRSSDVITLHCPLNAESNQMINRESLALMKKSAIDLRTALDNGTISGAAVDVLSTEPPKMDNALIGAPNCIITPHLAWGSNDARDRLMEITYENIKAFIEGYPKNVAK